MHLERASARCAAGEGAPVTYMVFDLLWLDGRSLMDEPYEERRERLEELGLDGRRWQTPPHVVGDGAQLLEARRAGARGHRRQAARLPYEPGRRIDALGQDQERRAPGARHRRLAARRGGRARAHRRALRRRQDEDGDAALRRARRHRLHRGRARPPAALLAPCERDTLPVRRGAARRRARAGWSSPSSSPRSSSPSGPEGVSARALLQGPAGGQAARSFAT